MYNPYGYPAGYGPTGPQLGPFGSGMMQAGSFQNAPQIGQQAPQTLPQAQSMPVVMQVSTIKQVEQAQVQPGGKALVLVANEPVIAMRTADNMGLTTTDYYRIERFDPDAAAAAVPAGDFVTRAEFQQALQSLAQQMQQAVPVAPAATEKEATKK